jgi:Kef-type K+ transport system membrane component KefB
MKSLKPTILYTGLIVTFGGLIYFLLHQGNLVYGNTLDKPSGRPPAVDFLSNFYRSNLQQILPRLLLQIVIIMTATRVFGFLFKKIGQPAVIGETMAGILLGPSLLGLLFPGLFHFVFPAESFPNLHFLSQIGLILFMFIIGLEVDSQLLRKHAFEAIIISHASIIIPFFLGVSLSFYLYHIHVVRQTGFVAFALFMGIAMSITAFPVLARIIRDRKLTNTKLGILAIGCAAADDVTAWCILALLIALIRSGSGNGGIVILVAVIIYGLIMLVPVRMLMKKVHLEYEKGKIGYNGFMSIVFTLLLISSWCTEAIGIHALFGAFLAGLIIPKNEALQKRIIDRISDLTMVMLLPLFFVYTGLRTQVAILNTGILWTAFLLIIICAVAGKFAGSSLVARALGHSWKNSLSIGAMMNTRGLMELVVLNIGYDIGILSPEIFSMMVLMALLTTMMTNPLLNWIGNENQLKFHKDG